eukprot:3127274-Pleurochrysis_carterae.AAC.1
MFTKRRSRRMLAKARLLSGYRREKDGIDGASNKVLKSRVIVIRGQKERTSGCEQVRTSASKRV